MLTPINIQKIELSIAYTAVYLGSEDRLFVIYLLPQSGKLLQHLIAKSPIERPSSFDVIMSLITASELIPQHVLINDEKDGVFHTKIFLEKKINAITEIMEIDARPTEAIAMAIKYQIPLLINTSLISRLNNVSIASQE